MKKILYAIAALLLAACLTSCNSEIKNVTINKLVGNWVLVEQTTVGVNGTVTTTKASGSDYMVITEDSITFGDGKSETTTNFTYSDPHFIIGGTNLYDLESLTRKEMVLQDKLVLGILITERSYKYQRK